MDRTVVGTLSIIELVWLLLMVSGIVLSVSNMVDGVRDRRQLHVEGVNGIAEVVVVGSIRTDANRCAQFVLLLGLGIFSAVAPPSPLVALERFYMWYRWMSLVAILGVGVLLWTNAVLTKVTRHRALSMYGVKRGGEGVKV